MKLVLGLYLRQVQSERLMISPIVGLSPLEIELLLDQSLEKVKDFHEENPSWRDENPPENRGNYYGRGDFLDSCRSVRNKIARERYLETPQIIVERGEERYSTSYNQQIEERIKEKLAQFKRTGEEGTPPADKIFSKRFAKEREWIFEQQLAIVRYLCATQDRYVKSRNPLDLEPITQEDVAENIGYSATSVCRLVKNLSVRLPDQKVIFAEELIPGVKATLLKGRYALRQLQQDSGLYENQKWKISDRELVPILKERFGIDVARRTVSKYKGKLG